MPRDVEVEIDLTESRLDEGFTIDLVRLHELHEPDAEALGRYAARVQVQRQDFNGRFLTIRRDDLRVLAAVLGRSLEELGARLDELGLRARVCAGTDNHAGSSPRNRMASAQSALRSARRDHTGVHPAEGARPGQPPHGRVARPA